MKKSPKSDFIIIYTTFPHRRQARRLAKNLLKENLIACANIFKIDSIYRWEGKLEEAREYGVFLKTCGYLYENVETKIKEYHPYDIPAILSWQIDKGSKEFLDWISKNASYKTPHNRISTRQKN